MALKLSILIATMPSRSAQLSELIESLYPQVTDEVEVLLNIRMDINIGAKRNLLLSEAQGEYIVFVDDDDSVSEDYIQKILGALGADCIGISGIIIIDASYWQQWHISRDYSGWYEKDGVYFRTPNHISPVRRELALKARFPEIENGEDYEYSMKLKPLLKTEKKVEGNIYNYYFKNEKS